MPTSERVQESGRGEKRPTVADVAREAGVSVGTVSHALSGARQLTPETRRKVDRAIVRLGFRPNLVARSLTKSRTMTIGMIVPDTVNPIFGELLRGAERVLAEKGYAVFFSSSDNLAEKEERNIYAMVERRVDGLILDVSTKSDGAFLLDLAGSLPLVLVDRTSAGWTGDRVMSDDEAGMGLAVDHLVGLGHTRIALINGEADVSGAQRRRAGFEQRLSDHGLRAELITHGQFTMQSGRQQTLELLDQQTRTTAICAGNDFLALGSLTALLLRGFSVPEAMSLVGYDDIEFSALVTPPLTTVSQPLGAMGSTAARLLLQRIEEPNGSPQRVMMRGDLIQRASTGRPRP